MGFIDSQRELGHAVESICRVLTSQGCRIAARTYRAWKRDPAPTRAELELAYVVNTILDIIFTVDAEGRRRLTPEGLYGRRKLTALLRRQGHDVNGYVVDKAMRLLGHAGIRRGRQVRTTIPGKDGTRAGDLLNRDFTAPRPDHTWVTDFTYVRTWAGWVYVAFILDVFSQRIVAWHAQTSKHVDLVMIPLRMALWERDRQGHRVGPDQLIHHSDAGSQGGFHWSSQHLVLGGVQGWQRRTGAGRPVMLRSRCVGSGARTGRCVRRCVPRGDRIRRGWCNASSGARSPRASRQRKRR